MYPFSIPWIFWCFQGVEEGCTRNKWVNTRLVILQQKIASMLIHGTSHYFLKCLLIRSIIITFMLNISYSKCLPQFRQFWDRKVRNLSNSFPVFLLCWQKCLKNHCHGNTRTKCFFLFPRNPFKIRHGLEFCFDY